VCTFALSQKKKGLAFQPTPITFHKNVWRILIQARLPIPPHSQWNLRYLAIAENNPFNKEKL
jgi:hypothetical protein